MPKIKRPDDERGNTDFIESLDRGLRVFELFGRHARPMTLSDVAKAADLPRATARRILFTLEHRGYVVSDGKLFALTPQVLTLAGSYMTSNQIVTILQPVLDRISSAAQEISSLAVLQGNDVIFVARASPARVFSAGIDLGYRLPAYCSSVGRAMLGKYSNEDLTEVLDAMTLTAMTPFTVTDKELLKAAIITDREKGYSLVDREAEPGFRSISVPVRRYDDAIVAAINMGAHVDRVSTGEMIDRFLPLLRDAATTVKPLLL
ncbi:IclR family transcriptional regulator [Rhodopseudomonas boonkerdii]|uniref:IclR family transcriptional regulator domain-containing protein n=1 Tax=Rhodopseudomonas boonkerdii TaxID=475937 RepID=UPI001E285B21|nr:IclR family transcriptional regulator C-terminal domain-containing protein [Rhodopseudomonas boonkerdii]UGV27782.1 IclR family transcriptional regulator [Rhodopseudomonas boonkerdii]